MQVAQHHPGLTVPRLCLNAPCLALGLTWGDPGLVARKRVSGVGSSQGWGPSLAFRILPEKAEICIFR